MNRLLGKYGLMLLFLGMAGCTEFFVKPDRQDQWKIRESDLIVLHYREPGFSDHPSPTPGEAAFILDNQMLYYRAIQDSIHRDFSEKVLIYLHNQDEAVTHIGTGGGGHSIPKFNAFYFSFFHAGREYTDQYGVENPFLGAHELVHVISHQTLGYPGTKLMSEGYANWLDGSYAKYDIRAIFLSYRDNEPEKIMTPDELLFQTERPDEVYYPNAGVFTAFLVRHYRIEKVNRLFTSGKEVFISDFGRIFDESWEEMNEKYALYTERLSP